MAKKKRTAKKTAKTSSSTSATPSLDTASVAEFNVNCMLEPSF